MKSTIDMAREIWESGTGIYEGPNIGQLKAFEALVRADERNKVWSQKHWTEYEQAIVAAEREACAKVCDDGYDTFFANNGVEHSRKRYDQRAVERAIRAGVEFVTADCATAIRARGNT
jgi:flavin-dependent dehydrogenase